MFIIILISYSCLVSHGIATFRWQKWYIIPCWQLADIVIKVHHIISQKRRNTTVYIITKTKDVAFALISRFIGESVPFLQYGYWLSAKNNKFVPVIDLVRRLIPVRWHRFALLVLPTCNMFCARHGRHFGHIGHMVCTWDTRNFAGRLLKWFTLLLVRRFGFSSFWTIGFDRRNQFGVVQGPGDKF